MANEQMTLLDYGATQKDPLIQAFINAMMDDNSPGGGMGLLSELPVEDMGSLGEVISRIKDEGTPLPSTRPIGGTYSSGVVTTTTESVNVGNYGQDVMIDLAFLKKTGNYKNGMSPEELQTKYLSSRMNRKVNNDVMNGNKAVDPNSFNGIRYFCDTTQVIDPSAGDLPTTYANGINVWSSGTQATRKDFLTGLDYLIDLVGQQNATLVMNNQAKRCIYVACRDNGFFKTTADAYDRKVETYRDVPIINPGAKNAVLTLKSAINNTNSILPNNLTFGSANNSCEIYVIRKGSGDGCVLKQYSPLDVRTVANEMTEGPAKLIRADWYLTFYRYKESAIGKFTGVIAV